MAIELDDIGLNGCGVDRARQARKDRFRLIRIERNYRAKDMATALGITRHTWTRWEHHGDEPSEANLERLHELTGRDYVWLRGE